MKGLTLRFSKSRSVGTPRSGVDALQPIDLLLTGISSSVAVYAAGASLASEKNALFFMWIVLLGTFCSSLVVWFGGKSQFVLADTTAYTVVALVAAFGISGLNNATPDAIYADALTMPGILCWMLALGSFTVWRDQTMLFQAVPAIALFGLVGCYDTFRASVIFFFAFLICQAILLSRAHGRAMLRQARSSGAEALEMSIMRKGQWRWMAGPEWALASSLTIVLISVIGAPILRQSARGFSGLVRYTPPQSPLSQSSLTSMTLGETKIGTGPNPLSDNPVLRVEIPEPLYLRGFSFGRYGDGGWMPAASFNREMPDDPTPDTLAVTDIGQPEEVGFRIEPLQIYNTIVPVPGEGVKLDGVAASSYSRNVGGTFSIRGEPPYPVCSGQALISDNKIAPIDADPEMSRLVPEYVQQDAIPQDVADLAHEVTKNAKTDYDKAVAIKREIERRVKYNLNAAKTPERVDPVSYFLFQSKEGYCDLFASAMTLMARSVGLPARYVTGYYPFQSDRDGEGRYIIRQKDAHAWCEIFFKQGGWVIFDATEGAQQVDGGSVGSSNAVAFWKSGWFLMIVSIFSLGGIGYCFYWALGNIRRYRKSTTFAERRTNRAKLRIRSRLRTQYLAFENSLKRAAKRPRGVSETISEYAASAQSGLGVSANLALGTASAFTAALYGSSEPDNTTIDRLQNQVKEFKLSRRRDR